MIALVDEYDIQQDCDGECQATFTQRVEIDLDDTLEQKQPDLLKSLDEESKEPPSGVPSPVQQPVQTPLNDFEKLNCLVNKS